MNGLRAVRVLTTDSRRERKKIKRQGAGNMAVKKTQLYASLWASCDKLRRGMDSSEYKDYILTLLFMKYVTDKFKNKGAYEDIKVFDRAHDKEPDPEKRTGCSFDDFIALKGTKNIGEGMDKIFELNVHNTALILNYSRQYKLT